MALLLTVSWYHSAKAVGLKDEYGRPYNPAMERMKQDENSCHLDGKKIPVNTTYPVSNGGKKVVLICVPDGWSPKLINIDWLGAPVMVPINRD